MQTFIKVLLMVQELWAIFTFSQLMENGICQSLGLDIVDINVYTKFLQNISYGSRDRTSLTVSEFGPRQRLDR